MKVLIADKFEQSGRDGLQAIGCEISFQPDLKDEALVAAIGREQPDVLVVRGTKVTEAMLAAGPLKLIVRAGAGARRQDAVLDQKQRDVILRGDKLGCEIAAETRVVGIERVPRFNQ